MPCESQTQQPYSLTVMPTCRSSCFLRSIQRRNKRQLEDYLETREDLKDLSLNEPSKRELTRQKIVHVDAQICKLSTRSPPELSDCKTVSTTVATITTPDQEYPSTTDQKQQAGLQRRSNLCHPSTK